MAGFPDMQELSPLRPQSAKQFAVEILIPSIPNERRNVRFAACRTGKTSGLC
jgi:hypothetical protein